MVPTLRLFIPCQVRVWRYLLMYLPTLRLFIPCQVRVWRYLLMYLPALRVSIPCQVRVWWYLLMYLPALRLFYLLWYFSGMWVFWNAITANYFSTKHSSYHGTTDCLNQCVRNKKAGCKEQAHVHIFSESLEVKACTSRQLLVTTYYSHFNLPLPHLHLRQVIEELSFK